jgi:large subunit ribosomal protein L1
MSELIEKINKDVLAKAIKEAKEKSKKRNFLQSVELMLAISGIDLKRPENRIRMVIRLPHKSSKDKRVAVFADGAVAEAAAEAGADRVISEKDIDSVAGSKKDIKKLASEFDFFLAEPKLMAKVGRVMGSVLGPRGKMPQILPPNADVKAIIEGLRSSVSVNVRNNPMVAVAIGTEDMDDEKLAENAMAVIEAIKGKLPEKSYIKKIYVKTSMGPSIRVM